MIKATLRNLFRRSYPRFSPLYLLIAVYLSAGMVLRLLLWWQFARATEVTVVDLLWILPVGLLNDAFQAAYLSLPLALYLCFAPQRWLQAKWSRGLLAIGFVGTTAALIFLSAAEYFFFEEFNSRFNLVAFDYLLYPTEVIGDIRVEYPVGIVLAAALAVAAILFGLLRRQLFLTPARERAGARYGVAMLHLAIVVMAATAIKTDSLAVAIGGEKNRVANELAANGMGSFVRAARTSEISYPSFYATRDSTANDATVAEFLEQQGGTLREDQVTRHFVGNERGLGKLNVVVVVEEAFGAEFSRLYGSEQNLTPRFDAYAQQGMWFSHMYASGTRTVRGLEAIAASFPPIPSVSILRRPNNEHIATWGGTMQRAGYHSSFIYGGYGYFDNMNYFFANNGHNVVDRTDIPNVRFANVWGVSDEDLFDRALTYYDERSQTAQPFFSIIMTTSNHKPYTFRDGVPGVPANGGGRAAGVRYADFALGYFLDEAKKHAWFDNTLFIVVADHGARVYGKAEIPLQSYEIPMMFYAPKHIQPTKIATLTGQIDIAPTILGLLGIEYNAPFFGSNVLDCSDSQFDSSQVARGHLERACGKDRVVFFNHNYDVATYRDGKLAVLGLGRKTQTLAYDQKANTYSELSTDRGLTDLTVAIYQTAYERFESHRYQ